MKENVTAVSPRMLTIREEAKVGPLSEYALRLLLKQGKLPGIYVGSRFLVNHNVLVDCLNGDREGAFLRE